MLLVVVSVKSVLGGFGLAFLLVYVFCSLVSFGIFPSIKFNSGVQQGLRLMPKWMGLG